MVEAFMVVCTYTISYGCILYGGARCIQWHKGSKLDHRGGPRVTEARSEVTQMHSEVPGCTLQYRGEP